MQRRSCFSLARPIRSLAVAGCMFLLFVSVVHGADFTGDWNGYIVSNYDGSSLRISAEIYQYGSNLTGTVIFQMDEYGYPDLSVPFSGTANGNIVSGTASLSYPGILEFQLQIYGALNGNTINGTYSLYAYIEGEEFTDTGTFVLTRVITSEFLSVTKSGTGSGTVSSSPPGIYCGAVCSASFNGGTVVTLTAAPDAGSYFVSWTGCDYVNGNVCTVTMNYARSVGTVFTVSPCLAAAGSLLYVDYGPDGIWKYNGTPNNWTKITPANPETMAAAGTDLYGDFGSNGIWKYNGTPNNWTKITPANPETMAAAGTDLYGDFGANGIWKYNGTPNNWIKISLANPEAMAGSDSALYCDLGSNGVWKYESFTWEKIAVSNPTSMAAGSSAVYGEYGVNGIWKYDGSWGKITQ